MSARFTAVLTNIVPVGAVTLDPLDITQASSATLAVGALTTTHAPRRRPKPRRVIVWVHDLDGVRVGAIT